MRGRGFSALLAAVGLVGLVGGAWAQQAPLEWNVRAQVQPLFDKLESGQIGSLAIVGDSISFHLDSYNWFLRDHFWADYGNAGDGYVGICTGFGSSGDRNGVRDGLRMTVSPTEVVLGAVNAGRDPWGWYTPEGLFSRVWGAGFVQLKVFGPTCRLHYLKQPGGGVMRVTLNNHVLLDAPTNGGIAHAWVDLSLGGTPNSLKTLKITSADGGVVQLSGIDMRTNQPGFVYHRLARGGAGPHDFILADNEATAGVLSDLSPDVLIVMLDWVTTDEKASFIADTNELLDYYAQTMPTTKVVLMTHHPFKDDIVDEATWYYQIARERNLGFINLFATFPGGAAQMKAMGLLDGDVHFSVAGGQWFGDYVYNLLKRDGTCQAPTIDGQTLNQEADEGSTVQFSVTSPNASSYQWRKDGQNIAGAVQPTLTLQAIGPADAGTYDCLLTNDCDTTASQPAALAVDLDADKSWWYRDADGDGYGSDTDRVFEIDQPDGYIAVAGDCDDGDPAAHPGADEVLNGKDDNCDGHVDEGLGQWWYLDLDGDGFGEDGQSVFAVQQPGGYAAAGGDCDDANPAVNPGAVEKLNGVDDDCDGAVDDGFERWWFRDADGDGYGDDLDSIFAVVQPVGYVLSADDCDDTNPTIYLGPPEQLNGIDDNCDGRVDEGFESWWYRDADGDGYGDDGDALFVIVQPVGYIAAAGDCDDSDGAVHPGAEEVFDGIDNDCDGETDENVGFVFYRDADGDGFGNASDMIIAGGEPEGYVIDSSDCNDSDAGVNPLAAEVCDGIDNNCDGNTDENAGPVITQDPAGLSAYVGETVQFSVADTGGAAYQWRKNGVNINGATGPTYQIVNIKLTSAGTYSVRISNGCGQAISAGAVLTVKTPSAPAAPNGLKGSEPVKGKAALAWTDNATGETSFQVWRQKYVGGVWQTGQVIATLPANAVSYSETPGAGVWRYRVRAGQGNKYSAWTAFSAVAPAPPTGLTAKKVNGSAVLAWNDMSDFEGAFTVQRQKNVSGVWQAAVTLPPLAVDAVAMNDSPGVGKYRYRMKAGNAGGSSAWTVWVSITL